MGLPLAALLSSLSLPLRLRAAPPLLAARSSNRATQTRHCSARNSSLGGRGRRGRGGGDECAARHAATTAFVALRTHAGSALSSRLFGLFASYLLAPQSPAKNSGFTLSRRTRRAAVAISRENSRSSFLPILPNIYFQTLFFADGFYSLCSAMSDLLQHNPDAGRKIL